MNANPAIKVAASSPHLRGVFWRVFAAVFVTVMITGAAITFVLPEMYASTARIKIETESAESVIGLSSGKIVSQAVYDDYYIQNAMEIMQSESVLSNVVSFLDLNIKWGRRYYGGQTLTISQATKILKKRLRLARIRNTKLVNITAFSEDRNEAAQIADVVGLAYQNYRIEEQHVQTAQGLAVLQEQSGDEEKQILTIQSNLVLLGQKFHIGPNAAEPDNTNSAVQPYWNEKNQLKDFQKWHQLFTNKISSLKVDLRTRNTSLVVLIDSAEPGKYPVRPNKPLCLTLTLLMATVLGVLAGGVAVWLARRQENAQG